MAAPAVVKALQQEFYGLRNVGGIVTHVWLTPPEWRRLCEWVECDPTVTTVQINWRVGRRWKERQLAHYHSAELMVTWRLPVIAVD